MFSIVEVGPEHMILNKYTSDHIIDLENRFVYPGFIDAHSHFYGYAEQLGRIDLTSVSNREEICQKVGEWLKSKNGDWIIGRGWDNTTWDDKGFPDKACLDEKFPDKFIVLKRVDGHAALVNQKVLDLAGINADSQVEGGQIITENGHCTGILIDRAVDLIEDLIPDTDESSMKELLREAEKNCFAVGLTSVCDAGLDRKYVEVLRKMHRDGELSIKLYIMLNPSPENFEHYLPQGPIFKRDISICSFKFYADGALGSRGAYLLQPYSDGDGEYRGLVLTPEDSLMKFAEKLGPTDFQMNTHAIGDGAVDMMLHIYAGVLEGTNDRRWRIEHAQVVAEKDMEMFGKYNIIPSVQPTHCTSDMDWAIDRLGEERIDQAYAYRDLMEENGMIAFGTDFPVESIDPLNTLLSAVKRTDREGNPPGGYRDEEAIDFKSSIRAMTIWAALANREEKSKGSLEAGKKADFVVFNRDLSLLDASNMADYFVESTWLNGVKVYSRGEK